MRSLILAVVSAGALALAVPNELLLLGSPWIGLIALVPYYAAIRIAPTRRWATVSGVVFGVVSTAAIHYWLINFGQFSVWTLGGVIFAYAIYHGLLTPFVHRALQTSLPWRPFVFAALWTGYEYLKSLGYLAFPWGLLSQSWNNVLPVLQVSEIAGGWTLTFVTALVSALLCETLMRRSGDSAVGAVGSLTSAPVTVGAGRRPPAVYQRGTIERHLVRSWGFAAVLIIAIPVYGVVRLAAVRAAERSPDVPHMNVLLVQHNSDAWLADSAGDAIRTAQRLTREGLLAAPDTDLVVWSETILVYAYPGSIYSRLPEDDPLDDFIASLGVPLLVGAPVVLSRDPFVVLNSAVLVERPGEIVGFYGKRRLVPFAESVPFAHRPVVREFYRRFIGLVNPAWTEGGLDTTFEVPIVRAGEQRTNGTVTAGTPVCFEDSFFQTWRAFDGEGARVMLNLTNNSWSRTDSAQLQHFAAARMRAVEFRRPLVRGTNGGYTSVVAIDGSVRASAPMFVEAYVAAEVPIPNLPRTPYSVLGDWFPILLLALLFGALIASAASNRTPAYAGARRPPVGQSSISP